MSENADNETVSESQAPNTVKSPTVGEILEKARLEKGMTVDDIDRITHISPGWVIVIEQGAWTQYQSMVYAKGHVKVYAEFLGLDTEALGKQFQTEWNEKVKPDPNDAGEHSNHSGLKVHQPGTGRNFMMWGSLLVVLSVLAIVGVRYAMVQHGPSSGKKPLIPVSPVPIPSPPPLSSAPARPENPASVSGTGPDANGAASPPPSAQSSESGALTRPGDKENPVSSRQVPSSSSSPTNPRGGLTLRMVALKNTWVVISVDDGTVRRFHLRAGESRFLTGKNFMTYSTEYGNGLVLFLNGKRLGLAGPTSDPVLRKRLNRLSLRPVRKSPRPDQGKKGKSPSGQGSLKNGSVPSSPAASVPQTSPAAGGKLASPTQEGTLSHSSQSSGNSLSQPQTGRTP
ncbi:MAG: helix-turn-helix domain-containing protein [Nitrospirae bacterium]|nr:MAG: hypothetical protein D084_Lepto4C00378G0003 [Leptospirillum sp. Group IV 'UBA BS']MCL4484776.1 helix-turn-helix domain-containing protein [Nitrospirota bacterium]